MKKEYIISHPSQLNSLSTLPLIRTMATGRIRLAGNLGDHPQRESFEQQLNKQYYACGCDTGARGLLLGIILGTGLSAYKYIAKDWSLTYALIIAGAGIVTTTLLGKLYGLYTANRKLKTTIAEVKKVWPPEKEGIEEKNHCG